MRWPRRRRLCTLLSPLSPHQRAEMQRAEERRQRIEQGRAQAAQEDRVCAVFDKPHKRCQEVEAYPYGYHYRQHWPVLKVTYQQPYRPGENWMLPPLRIDSEEIFYGDPRLEKFWEALQS